MTRFIVIRHCEAQGNRERRFQGTYDADISELGKKQLEYLGLRFRNENIDYIFSSSRKRAIATAQAVNEYHHLPIQIDDQIIEIRAGEWEGKRFADFPVLFPKEMDLWDHNPAAFVAPGGESMQSVYDRMVGFVKKKAVEYPGKTIIVASHGCAIRNLLCWADGLGFENLKNEVWCANTAVNIIDVDEALEPHLVLKNDIAHLPEALQTLSFQKWNSDK